MPTSPLSSAEAARKAVAADLANIRLDAELTKREIARRCGWSESKSSRIESATTAPSDADIRAWCRACGVPERAPDVIARSRCGRVHVCAMAQEPRRWHARGARGRATSLCLDIRVPYLLLERDSRRAANRRVRRRNYEADHGLSGHSDDVDEAVRARLERGTALYQPGHTFAILLEQSVLHYRPGSIGTMAGQLGRLLEVMALPAVSLGVVPWSAQRAMWPLEAFYAFDDRLVVVETLTAEINVQQPSEVADCLRAFAELSKRAVYGAAARALITGAVDSIA